MSIFIFDYHSNFTYAETYTEFLSVNFPEPLLLTVISFKLSLDK